MAGVPASALGDPVTFDEVALYFSPEEWEELAEWQRSLYKEVMRDNYDTLVSLGLTTRKPDLIVSIEEGKGEPCAGQARYPRAGGVPNPKFLADGQTVIKKEFGPEKHPCHLVQPGTVKSPVFRGGYWNTSSAVNRPGTMPPWHPEPQWQSQATIGKQAARVESHTGPLEVSGGGFWPVGTPVPQPGTQEEMLLICTQCQKCFPACSAQRARMGRATQVCPECEDGGTRRGPSAAEQRGPAAAVPCSCGHCPGPQVRPRAPREERPYKCGKCEKSFRYVHEYTWHQKVHAGEKIFKCGTCEKVFRHKQELMWHQRAHTAEWPHKCGACGKNFRFKQELMWHQKTHSVERPYKCAECDKSFRFKQEFMWHHRAHVGDRPYKCNECEKSFRFKQEYSWHQRSHAGEKTYKCPGCDKSFRYKQEFYWHQRIHTGEQPYPCASCDSTFTCRQEYMRHQRLHDGEKPYQCPHCEKTFRRGSTLIRHRRVHLGEGPFRCSPCGRAFDQSASLMKHQRIHTVKDECGANPSGWGPCLQNSGSPAQTAAAAAAAANLLGLKTVSVGGILFLNLPEPKKEKGPSGVANAWEPQI